MKLYLNGFIFLAFCFLEAKLFDWMLGVANLHWPSALAMFFISHLIVGMFIAIGLYAYKSDQ